MTTKGLKVVMALRTHWTTQGLKARPVDALTDADHHHS
jgi:hypothetical protein